MKYYMLKGRSVVVTTSGEDFGNWFNDPNGKRVAQTEVAPGVKVSTVCLGLNHNWDDDGDPIIFETMVFGGVLDGYQE